MERVKGSFLVAADGARSPIRSSLGILMQGTPVMQELVNIHFMAPTLGKQMAATNPAMLYFIFNQEAVVVIVAHDLDKGEFVAQVSLQPWSTQTSHPQPIRPQYALP